MSISGLLTNNPLYHVFSGAQSLAYTLAVVLFLSALVAFGYRNKYTGIGLVIGSGLSVATAITVYEPPATYAWVIPVLTAAATIGLLTLACLVAWSQDYTLIGKVVIVNAVLFLASVAAALFAGATAYTHLVSSDWWNTWVSVETYMWAAITVLGASLAIVSLIAAAMYIDYRRNVLPGIRWLQPRTAGRSTTPGSNDTADSGLARFAR